MTTLSKRYKCISFFLLFMLLAPGKSIAQNKTPGNHVPTKEETIKWLVDKLLKKYATVVTATIKKDTALYSDHGEVDDIRTFTYKVTYDKLHNRLHIDIQGPVSTITLEFNINDIISYSVSNQDDQATYSIPMLELLTAYDKVDMTVSLSPPNDKTETKKANGVALGIDFNAEPNLQDRMVRALDTLIKYNKPVGGAGETY